MIPNIQLSPETLLIKIGEQALRYARETQQVIGAKNDYYLTLEQLNNILSLYQA